MSGGTGAAVAGVAVAVAGMVAVAVVAVVTVAAVVAVVAHLRVVHWVRQWLIQLVDARSGEADAVAAHIEREPLRRRLRGWGAEGKEGGGGSAVALVSVFARGTHEPRERDVQDQLAGPVSARLALLQKRLHLESAPKESVGEGQGGVGRHRKRGRAMEGPNL